MGAVAEKLFFKGGKEKMESSHDSLWTIGATDIDGKKIEQLGNLMSEKKAVLVVNVATK